MEPLTDSITHAVPLVNPVIVTIWQRLHKNGVPLPQIAYFYSSARTRYATRFARFLYDRHSLLADPQVNDFAALRHAVY